MSDIFLSYAREDMQVARRVAKALETQGWSVFWDLTIRTGARWRETIDAALTDARCVVVLWSRNSVKSHWVIEEADHGLKQRVLVPAFLESVEPPLGFRSIQAADLSTWVGDFEDAGIQQFLGDLGGILGPAPVLEAKERRKAEPEAKRRGEKQRRQQAEAEAKRQAEEQRLQQAEAEARRQAEEQRPPHESSRSQAPSPRQNFPLAMLAEFGRANAAAQRYEDLRYRSASRESIAADDIPRQVFEEFYSSGKAEESRPSQIVPIRFAGRGMQPGAGVVVD